MNPIKRKNIISLFLLSIILIILATLSVAYSLYVKNDINRKLLYGGISLNDMSKVAKVI